MLFLVERSTAAAKATVVHTASAHVLLLLFSHSKMKFVEVACKQQTTSASASPRPPETRPLTSHLFLTPPSRDTIFSGPVAATHSLPWPRLSWPCLRPCPLLAACSHALPPLVPSCPRTALAHPRSVRLFPPPLQMPPPSLAVRPGLPIPAAGLRGAAPGPPGPPGPPALPGQRAAMAGTCGVRGRDMICSLGSLSFAFYLFLSLFFFNYSISTIF